MEGHVSACLSLVPFGGGKLYSEHPPQPLGAHLGLAWKPFHLVCLIKLDTKIKAASRM